MGARGDRVSADEAAAAFGLLGLRAGASADDVARARRALAKLAHPDAGGTGQEMQALNEAATVALAWLDERREHGPAAGRRSARRRSPAGSHRWRTRRDHPSFTVEADIAHAYRGLMLVVGALGTVVDTEPDHLIDAILDRPTSLQCQIELVAEAGATTVSLAVAAPGDQPVEVDTVRDALIAELNQLVWNAPDGPRRP